MDLLPPRIPPNSAPPPHIQKQEVLLWQCWALAPISLVTNGALLRVSLQNITLMNFNAFCCILNSLHTSEKCDPTCRKVDYNILHSH